MAGPKCITCQQNGVSREASYCYPAGHPKEGKRIYCKNCSTLPTAERTILKYEYKRLKDRTRYQQELTAYYQYQATLATQQATEEQLPPAHVTEQPTEEIETEETTQPVEEPTITDETELPSLTPEEKAYVLKYELKHNGWCFFDNFR